jgi:hypothetical protein
MIDRKESHHIPACPACGQPVSPGFFKISEKVKMVLVLALVGYVIASALLLGLSLPPEMRRHQRTAEWDTWMQPLSREPAFQIVVGVGVALGVLIFYWDWFQNMYENWQKKREKPVKEPKAVYKYKCRVCGREWN